MFFGLKNSPPTFQRMMNHVFRYEIQEGWLLIYMDDVLIFSKSLRENQERTKRILAKFRENDLFLKAKKCDFDKTIVTYLGLIIEQGKIRMDPTKTEAITSWPAPTKKKELQSFLRFLNFYRRFIRNFAELYLSLTKLTGKAEWIWEQDQQDAFDALEKAITNDPILALPNRNGKFTIECNASDFATGAVLSQEQDDGTYRPIAFISHSMTLPERNYDVHDKELLAIVRCFKTWRSFLLGFSLPHYVYSNHENLTYFRQAQDLTRRQARWITYLQDYNFKIFHRKGSLNKKADLLSRRAGHDKGNNDNKVTIGLPDALFTLIHIHPENREEIIQQHHDDPIAGHNGIKGTIDLISRYATWETLEDDVRKYVNGCSICQEDKPNRGKQTGTLNPHQVPPRPWHTISIDMIGPLPEARGYDAVFTVVDKFSKHPIFIPTTTTLTSEGWACLLVDHVSKRFGLPQYVISDRGSIFISKFIKEWYRILGIKGPPTTAYHPWADGQSERMNQEVEIYLRHFINHQQDDWPDWTPIAEFSLANRKSSTTGYSPFFITQGQHPWTGNPLQDITATNNESITDLVKRMATIHQTAKDASENAQKIMKRRYDKHHKPVIYKKGDKVWLDVWNFTSERPSKKLDHP